MTTEERLDLLAEFNCTTCAHFDPRESRCYLSFAPHQVDKPACTTWPLWRKPGSGMNV